MQRFLQIFVPKNLPELLLLALCGLHLLANLLWLSLNTAPLPWDQAGHTLIAFDFLSFFQGESSKSFLSISNYYPPLLHIIVALVMFPFGLQPIIGGIVVTIFFLLAIVLLYLYTDELFHNKAMSFVAACIFSFLPLIYGLSRWFLLEIPLITFILASLYFLQRSSHLSKAKPVMFFAIFAACALLTKWTAIVFLIIPFIFQMRRISNPKLLALAMCLGALLLAPWYIVNAHSISETAQLIGTRNFPDPVDLLSRENLFWYFSLLANFQLTWIGTILFLLAVFSWDYSREKRVTMLLANILFCYVVFTFIENKNVRYTLPFLPFIAMIISLFLVNISRNKWVKMSLIALLIPYTLFYFFSLSFGFPIDPKKTDYQKAVFLPIIGPVDYVNFGKVTSRYLAPTIDQTVWPNKQILSDVSLRSGNANANVLLVVDKENFHLGNLVIEQKMSDFSNLNLSAPYTTFSFDDFEYLKRYVAYFHFALIAQKSFGPGDALRHKKSLEQLKAYIQESPEFRKIGEYPLPDGDILYLYSLNKEFTSQ